MELFQGTLMVTLPRPPCVSSLGSQVPKNGPPVSLSLLWHSTSSLQRREERGPLLAVPRSQTAVLGAGTFLLYQPAAVQCQDRTWCWGPLGFTDGAWRVCGKLQGSYMGHPKVCSAAALPPTGSKPVSGTVDVGSPLGHAS